MSNATIEVKDLVVSRGGKKVLHSIGFSVPKGEITTLLGANGAGKSSTVLTLAGVLKPDNGTIEANGQSLVGLSPDVVRQRGVALVPEGHRVLGGLSVHDNLRVASMGRTPSEIDGHVEHALSIFPELKERLKQRASDLSGGQKQMVAVSQAFIARSDFMLVDELSLGLAPTVVHRLADALKVAADEGIGVLLIEQFAHLALDLAKNALVMERGRVVYQGSSAELKERPDILHSAYLADEAAE